MKKIISATLICLAFCRNAPASGTHTSLIPPLQPEHYFSEPAYQTAKTWFLPDFQGGNRDNGSRSQEGAGKDSKHGCSFYGNDWRESYDSSTHVCQAHRIRSDLTCYSDCRCKDETPVGTGEKCLKYCENTLCISKTCKNAVIPETGEKCTESCASDPDVCTAKSCKPAVTIGNGEKCVENCAADRSICTVKTCASGYLPKNGLCLYDVCPFNYGKNPCTADQILNNVRYTYYGSSCYNCISKAQKCLIDGYQKISDWPKPSSGQVAKDSAGNPLKISALLPRGRLGEWFGIKSALAGFSTSTPMDDPDPFKPCMKTLPDGSVVPCSFNETEAGTSNQVSGGMTADNNFNTESPSEGNAGNNNFGTITDSNASDHEMSADNNYNDSTTTPNQPTSGSSLNCNSGYIKIHTNVCVTEGYNEYGMSRAVDKYYFAQSSACPYDVSYVKGKYILASSFCRSQGFVTRPEIIPPEAVGDPSRRFNFLIYFKLNIKEKCQYNKDYVKYQWDLQSVN